MLNFTFVHSSCYSNIGRTGGEQDISLMGACLKTGTAVHEMMHALGFWHEQSRPDRDTWVHVIQSNIQEGKGHNSHLKISRRNRMQEVVFKNPFVFHQTYSM